MRFKLISDKVIIDIDKDITEQSVLLHKLS